MKSSGGWQADLVLSGGGVLGIGHAGAVSVLQARGYRFPRIAGTSAGSIVAALLAAGISARRLRELVQNVDYGRFLDKGALDRVPLIGPPLSVVLENGYAEGRAFAEWLARELEGMGVRTFGDLRIDGDAGADPRPSHRWKLVVMVADVTRGQLLRLPWDYERYGLDPDEQPVAEAVRASISVPYLFEPVKLRHPGGESLLVDGGLVSNFPIDAFDRTDGRPSRWPTFGVTLLPQLPAGDTKLVPALRPLRLVPGFHFLESVITTAIVGRDQGYLAQPWVRDRAIEVDGLGIDPFDFTIGDRDVKRLYRSGQAAARRFLEHYEPSRSAKTPPTAPR